MKIPIHINRSRRQAAYIALFIVLVLVGASVLLLSATLSRSTSNVRLNDRSTLYTSGNSAAEAAVEKVLARMMVDFDEYGEAQVITNLSLYRTGLLPTSTENLYWTNFIWSDGTGNDNRIYVARTSTTSNATFVSLEEQYAGLWGYSSTYRILANCRWASSTYSYNFTNAVQYDVQLAQIPIFQFAIFYNGLLEFSDCAPLTIDGTVHANTNIYVGSPDTLTFNGMVTTTGTITDPANCGLPVSYWTGAVNYNGTPKPGYLTGQTAMTLPIGTNSTIGSNVQQILYPPPAGESVGSAMGAQRYYNKANMTIWISNNTYTITLKSSSSDPGQLMFSDYLTKLTNNPASNYFNFLSTTNTLYDTRENKTVDLTQIDVVKLSNWMQTNIYVYGPALLGTNYNKFSSTLPLNIVWVADYRPNNSSTLTAVRMVNGRGLPSAGLTVATPNPIYIQGYYNCPNSANLGSTNVTGTAPASVAADALTILSPNWSDSKSFQGANNVNAASDTVDAAIIAGNVPSTGTNSTSNSGGVHNLPRLLENWSGQTLTLNTSIVCLFGSTWATGQFLMPAPTNPSGYYEPPSRQFFFNQNYTTSAGMPPGTPLICRLIRASWCNPPPMNVNYFSQTLDYASH